MKLKDAFEKNIARPIEGVIKADDASHLSTEVEEYVLANEIQKGLELFLEEYTNYTNANGVWISGFFGSGKSHMLKMLAHLLGEVDGQEFPRGEVSSSFLSKADGEFLPGLLDKAASIPAKSLLFNIDQKATLISKDQRDALLRVFVKVFDESRGYYGGSGSVAKFESDLDRRGEYERFKAAYREIAGKEWAQGREEGVLEESNVSKAFAKVSGQGTDSTTNILTKYRSEYAVSIEDFADDVADWLASKDPGYRLNFFVDEVGQYIGTDAKLMLNLQTIAESLNTKCAGRAWVLVTSQEDMEKVIGDQTRSQGNDFSKIQARFATRLKLTSADVEEVIRKRLLEKNPQATDALEDVYDAQSANFKTLFDFVDGAKTYRNYTDESQFVGIYPFVTYQFPLFQSALVGISDHNVFEGRNQAVGERSMLGVVQEVAKDIGDSELGALATFDELFSGIRASLKSAAQRSILTAEKHLENELAIKLLKALFLVKHVEDFHATPRNLTVLMYDEFGRDLPQLATDVKEALSLLEQQTYVQRNGNTYEYLTNEEQVIEEEIKNVDLDSSQVSQRLAQLISADVLRMSKIRYEKSKQDFPFGLKLDDQPHGPQRELTVHVISPAYEDDISVVRMQSAGHDELRVVLATDARLLSDLRLLLKTEKYIKRKQSTSQSNSVAQILTAKAGQNEDRKRELIQRARAAVGTATLITNAIDIDVNATDPQARVSEGFQDLIRRAYPQLKMLGDHQYSEGQIADTVNPKQATLAGTSKPALGVPAEEVLSHVTSQEKLGARVTIKTIVEHFEGKPYGWYLAGIQVAIARLVGTSKVSLNLDGNVMTRTEIPALLRNSTKFAHTDVLVQKQYDQHKVRALRDFGTAFFDDPNPPREPIDLAHYVSERLRSQHSELAATIASSSYPFVQELATPAAMIKAATGHADEWYLGDFTQQTDELLEAKENFLDPITTFLASTQKEIYDTASSLLRANQSNIAYLPVDTASPVEELLADPDAFRGNRMKRLKKAASSLESALAGALESARTGAIEHVTAKIGSLKADERYAAATEDAKTRLSGTVSDLEAALAEEVQIGLIQSRINSFDAETYPSLVDLAFRPKTGGPGPIVHTVPISSVQTSEGPSLLCSEQDVEEFIAAYRAALIATVQSGRRVAR